jgi:nicotinate phosphoribosyltransferase
LKSGVPNAIRAFKEEVVTRGYRPKGIRIDSGDLAYLSKQARKMLDDAGFSDCKIVASSGLDEFLIKDILNQGARIDIFGVGERLITSKSEPVFSGVYKLTAIEKDGIVIPKIKVSENVAKITNPSRKMLYRILDNHTGKAVADVITLHDEEIDSRKPYELFDPDYTWKKTIVENYTAKKLLVRIFESGVCIYQKPSLQEIRHYCMTQVDTLWEDVLRFENPHNYYVDLSRKLWNLKNEMINDLS